jgi:transcriptional regulator with XRE-family HTH domain
MVKSQCSSRGIPVCGARLKELRKRRGWTQQELAHHSGYCDRLIRKAESSGTVSEETLEILAQTLSDNGCQVSVDDLSLSNHVSAVVLQESIVGRSSFESLLEHTHTNISIDCSKVDCRLPLHGVFRRQAGLIEWYSACSFLADSDRLTFSDIVLLDNAQDGYFHAQCEFHAQSADVFCFDLDLRFHFKDFLIYEVVWLSSLDECAVLAHEWEQHLMSQYLKKLENLDQAKNDPISA